MQEELVTFETAKLAKEKGYNIEGQTVFDLKNDNKIINFKDNAIQEFINDVETGYRDKALYYLKDGINVTDDNTDEGYFLLAPTQSLLQKWLREKHNIHLIAYKNINIDGYDWCYITTDGITNINSYKTYEEAYEIGLQEALKQISNI